MQRRLWVAGPRVGLKPLKGKPSYFARQRLKSMTNFCRDLEGRDCIVFGSAPSPTLGDYRGEKLICCNGSALTLKQTFDLEPDFSFLHCHVLGRESQSDQDVRDALGQVHRFGRTVVFDQARYEYSLDPIRPKADAITTFDWRDRFEIVHHLIGARLPKLQSSTGAVTCACVLLAGARSVRLVGFSLTSKGHSYNGNQLYRNHVRSDAALYALLGQYGYNLVSTELSISMVLTAKIE